MLIASTNGSWRPPSQAPIPAPSRRLPVARRLTRSGEVLLQVPINRGILRPHLPLLHGIRAGVWAMILRGSAADAAAVIKGLPEWRALSASPKHSNRATPPRPPA